MNKTLVGVGMVLVATALVAQDSGLTPEQMAAKCEAEGGCALFTFAEFSAIVLAEKANSYQQGLRACNNSI